MIKKFNISKPKKYMKDNVEKTFWVNVGTMTEFTKDDGSISRKIEIPAIGLEAQVFPAEPKVQNNQTETTTEKQPVQQTNEPTEFHKDSDVNPEDIPF